MKGLISWVKQKLSFHSLAHKTDFFQVCIMGFQDTPSLWVSVSVPNLHIRGFLRSVEYALVCVFRHSQPWRPKLMKPGFPLVCALWLILDSKKNEVFPKIGLIFISEMLEGHFLLSSCRRFPSTVQQFKFLVNLAWIHCFKGEGGRQCDCLGNQAEKERLYCSNSFSVVLRT